MAIPTLYGESAGHLLSTCRALPYRLSASLAIWWAATGVEAVVSFDRAIDRVKTVQRIEP